MKKELAPVARIAQSIYPLRGQKVMLDLDLAILYGVATKVLNQAVKRNSTRFPGDFMFRLTAEESERLLFQTGISKQERHQTDPSRSQIVTLKRGQNIKYCPYAFTGQSVAMLSSVLKSDPSGERTRLACWRWRPRHRELFLTRATLFRGIHLRAFRRGRRKQHARRVRSPIQST